MTPKPRICKDCGMGPRPAPHPGPRCATHHRAIKRLRSKANHEKRVQAVYGIDAGDYDLLYIAQEAKCPICERATGATRRLSVDHDHRTGNVRGLLCRPCNKMLGHARDDPMFFIRAARYLTDPPYKKLKL